MKRKPVNHGKVAKREAKAAFVDGMSVVVRELGEVRHVVSGVGHAKKAFHHTQLAVKKAVKSRVKKVKRNFGL